MNLRTLSDKNLHERTIDASRKEKSKTLELLRHLTEVQRRVLYAEYGYSTLYKYVIYELGYSEGECWTRIQAMKLIRTSKFAEEKIAEGALSLSNAAEVQKYIQEFNYTDPGQVNETIDLASQRSHRALVRELDRRAHRERTEKKIVLRKQLLDKIERLNRLLDTDMTELEMIEMLLDKEVRECELRSQRPRTSKKVEVKNSRYIPVQVRRAVVTRSQHQCEFRDKNGKRCAERRNLQFDHLEPYALGGQRTEQNIQMLCSAHNQRRMVKTFGVLDRPPNISPGN
ncbi:MAG: HNH endonuclease [Bdellovibrio sp.]|nr:HNH endonuclease [Bdellovibrio sp.]